MKIDKKALSGEVKHTALPWTYFKGNAKGVGLIRVESSSDARPSGEHICSFTRNQEANAEFIVTACNAYYKLKEDKVVLLEACKEIVKYMKNETNNPLVVYNKVNQAIEKANA